MLGTSNVAAAAGVSKNRRTWVPRPCRCLCARPPRSPSRAESPPGHGIHGGVLPWPPGPPEKLQLGVVDLWTVSPGKTWQNYPGEHPENPEEIPKPPTVTSSSYWYRDVYECSFAYATYPKVKLFCRIFTYSIYGRTDQTEVPIDLPFLPNNDIIWYN